MIASVCGWHEHHGVAAEAIERRLNDGESLVVAGPSVVEAYAVLTRLPSPHRLSPPDAAALVQGNFTKGAMLVVLDAAEYEDVLSRAPAMAVAGGRAYDLVIALCALKGRAAALLTLNDADFSALDLPGLIVSRPA